MPIEYKLFMNVPLSDVKCPRCGISSNGFMRGYVHRSRRVAYILWRRPYCAIICHVCKDIIGWESPPELPKAEAMKFEYEEQDPDIPWAHERRWWLLDERGRVLKLEYNRPFKNMLGVILLNLRKIVGR